MAIWEVVFDMTGHHYIAARSRHHASFQVSVTDCAVAYGVLQCYYNQKGHCVKVTECER